MVITSSNVPRNCLLAVFLASAALGMSNCGSVEPTPTAPSATTPVPSPSPGPTPAPAPAPAPSPQPAPSGAGKLQVTISPNPVPWSSNPIPNCSLTNTWTYTQTLENVGGAEITLSDRTDFFDGALATQKSGLGIVIPPGSKTTLTTRWCSANTFEHHTRTDFTGTDSRNNRINFTGPEVTLSKM
jgi:hypothetical protein